ncbi:hypothetical protein VTO42DRAFT_781 [Malbranchea cinnamomea]
MPFEELSLDFPSARPSVTESASSSRARRVTKTRSACDRCHSQKLRCVRNAELTSCERCRRLGTICRFSARAPRGSLKSRRAEQMSTTTGELLPVSTPTTARNLLSNAESGFGEGIDLFTFPDDEAIISPALATTCPDFSVFRWNGFTAVQNGLSAGASGEPGNESGPNDVVDLTHTLSPCESFLGTEGFKENRPKVAVSGSVVHKLSSLSAGLYECAANLPCSHGGSSSFTCSPKPTRFVFEDLFHHTLEFIDVLRCFVANGDASRPSMPFMGLDEPTMLMAFSCYSRLIEIYLTVFHMLRACIENSLAPRPDKEWSIVLPPLQAGGCMVAPPLHVDIDTRPPPATTSRYGLMILLISSQFWTQLREIVMQERQKLTCRVSTFQDAFPSLSQTLWQTFTDRTDHMLQTINALETSMLQ